MNGKKAKLMRKVGKGLTKKDKRLYNSLNSEEREVLAMLYHHIITKNKDKSNTK